MERKDYILREIEKMGILIQALLGKLLRKDNPEVVQENFLNEFNVQLNMEGDFDLTRFLSTPKEQFHTIFTIQNGFNFDNIESLADLLTLLSNKSRPEMQLLLRKKALELYRYVSETSKTYSLERQSKINNLE